MATDAIPLAGGARIHAILDRRLHFQQTCYDDKLVVGCYLDDLFILHSTDADGSLYSEFFTALVNRWRVEDEDEVSDLLNVDIAVEGDDVVLRQTSYMKWLMSTHAPDVIPASFQTNHAPAQQDLPSLVEEAVSTRDQRAWDEALTRRYQSLVGALLYCSTNTRPDTAYAVGISSAAL
eukprot:3060225-Pleurochrysis_carterae.AAC.1